MTYEEWILILGSIGQTTFVLIWATTPWWREWIGRAIMVKGASIAALFDMALAYWLWPQLMNTQISHVVQAAVVFGIWSQLCALVYEMHSAKKAGRRITGTHHDDSRNSSVD